MLIDKAIRIMAGIGAAAALALGLIAATAPAHAVSEWRLEKDENGVRIESRAVPGWEIREMRGIARYDGSVEQLVAVIEDPTAAPQLNEFVAESKIVDRDSDGGYRIYALTKMPWPLKDRDVVMQRLIERDPRNGTVTVTDEAVAGGIPEKKGLVRIRRSHNRWTLTPAKDGGAHIELRMLSDPAGPIPSSLINSMSVGIPFRMIERLRTLAVATSR
jgi:hypothetical protein